MFKEIIIFVIGVGILSYITGYFDIFIAVAKAIGNICIWIAQLIIEYGSKVAQNPSIVGIK